MKQTLTKDSNVLLITHNDLDGIGCEIVGRLAFENIKVVHTKNPDDATETLKDIVLEGFHHQYDKIFITDISISTVLANYIDMLNNDEMNKFQLLDHHATALNLNDFDWCKVKVESDSGQSKCLQSGTNLFYEYLKNCGFFKLEAYTFALSCFVEKVRRYDCWEWKTIYDDKEALDLNTLFWMLGREDFANMYINKFQCEKEFVTYKGCWIGMISESERMLLSVEDNRKHAYINRKQKQMFTANLFGNAIGVVFAEQFISELGNELSDRNHDLKYIFIIDAGANKVSLRTIKEDINLGQDVAKAFGGGGHAKASGFEYDVKLSKILFFLITARNKHTFDNVSNLVLQKGLIGKLTKLVDKFKKK